MLEQNKSAHSFHCWLPLKERIMFKVLFVTYKILHGFAPIYLNELLFNLTRLNLNLNLKSLF